MAILKDHQTFMINSILHTKRILSPSVDKLFLGVYEESTDCRININASSSPIKPLVGSVNGC